LIFAGFSGVFVLISDSDSADFPIHRHVLSISRKNAEADSEIPILTQTPLMVFPNTSFQNLI